MHALREYLPVTIFFLVMLQFSYTSIIQRIRIKKINLENLVCPKCQHAGARKPRITNLGFMKFTCLGCEKNFVLPLSKEIKIAYVFLVILSIPVVMIAVGMIAAL